MVSLYNIPCSVSSLIAEFLLLHNNDFGIFSFKSMGEKSIVHPAAQSIKLVGFKVTSPSLGMGLLQSEEAR